MGDSEAGAVQVVAARPRKVVTARPRGRAALNKVPDDIINDPELRLAMEVLPDNYNLEIPKVLNTCKSIVSFDTNYLYLQQTYNKANY